ncbi:unnamed protein product [Sphagnum tenellum]
MENRVKGWCAEDEPCSSSSRKKQTAQTLQAKMLFLSHLFEFVLGWYVISEHHLTVNCEQSAYLGCLLTSSTKDNIEQITLHV